MKTVERAERIASLDELWRCEFVIVNEKPIHKGWFGSWPLRLAADYINHGIHRGYKIQPETKEEA